MSSPPRQIREHWHIRTLSYRLADAIAIVLAWLSMARLAAVDVDQSHTLAVTAAILVFHFVGEITGMYRNWRGVAIEKEIACTLLTWAVTIPLVVTLVVNLGETTCTPRFLTRWLCVAIGCLCVTRVVLRVIQGALRARGLNTRGFAVVGINDLAFQLVDNIKRSPEMGLRFVGFYDDRDAARTPQVDPRVGNRLGNLDQLVEQARSGEVSMIYITFPMRAENRIRNVLNRLADTTASVYIVPDFFVYELLHSRWTSVGGLPTVSVFENPFYGVDGLVKRALDVTLAALLLAVLALPMFVIGLLVKATSRGPIFFRQRRYGLDGREILVWKFRSMTVCENGRDVAQATRGDHRATRFGAMLRSTSLDELPQLFNVLNGTMSLVGPRPHATAHNEAYRSQIKGYMLRHKVKPGITGLAQVSGWRGETDTLEKMERRVECDHRYIREWSLMMDVKILFKTILVVMSRQNAY